MDMDQIGAHMTSACHTSAARLGKLVVISEEGIKIKLNELQPGVLT